MNSACTCSRNIRHAVQIVRCATMLSLVVAAQSAAEPALPPLFRIGKGTLGGLVDPSGRIIVSPHAHAFLNGLAAVQRKGEYGYIDRDGRVTVPFRYADAGYTYNDRMPVALEVDGKVVWGLIDTSGETILPIEYDCVEWVDLSPQLTQLHGKVTWKVF